MLPRQLVVGRHGFSTGNFAWILATEGDKTLFLELLEEWVNRPDQEAELTETGRQQIIIMGYWLSLYFYKFDRLYRSPLRRAKQSADLLGIAGEWIECDYLREQHLGVLEYLTPTGREQYLAAVPNQAHLRDPYNFAPDRGESFADVLAKGALPFLDMLERECQGHERVFVMGHSRINKMIDCKIRGWTPEEFTAHYIHGDNKISNGMFIEYSRINPWTGEESTTYEWMRVVCPWFEDRPSAWQLTRPPFSVMRSIRRLISQASKIIRPAA